jgi:pristinamycin I synthase-3/4
MAISDRLSSLTPEQRALFEKLREQQKKQKPAAPKAPQPPEITRRGPGEHWPLSFDQERLWFLYMLNPQETAYNIDTASRIRGPLDFTALSQAFQEIPRRHEIWRTVFPAVDGRPVQVVLPEIRLPSSVVDLRALPLELREPLALELMVVQSMVPFVLETGPLATSMLLRIDDEDCICQLTVHHIVTDWVTFQLFWKEIGALYEAYVAGRPSPLPEPVVQFADYAVRQREWMQGEVEQFYLRYWLERLRDVPLALDLPIDRPRPPVQTSNGERWEVRVERAAELKAVARREGLTPFMTVLAAYQMLLSRHAGQEKVIVGSPNANRNRVEIQEIFGFFLTQLPFASDFSGTPTLREGLRRVRDTTLGAYAHQDLPFGRLVAALQPERDLSRAPIIQNVLLLLDGAVLTPKLADLELKTVDVHDGNARYDVMFAMWDHPELIHGWYEYNSDLWDKPTVARLAGGFIRLIDELIDNPERPLLEVPLLSAAERQQVVAEWNDTEVDYPEGYLLHELVAGQAARTPEAVAVVAEEESLTYRELQNRAGQLARHLTGMGVRPEGRVGVLLERSPEMMVGLLGVMEAGAAYVPLDPSYPAERLALLMESAGTSVVLAQSRLSHLLPGKGERVVVLDQPLTPPPPLSRPLPPDRERGEEERLAYVLYTSGSTGAPKGVMIPHRGIVNRLLWMQDAYRLTPEDRVLQKTPFSFDVSVWELFWPLLTGARLVFARPEGHKDALYLAELIARERITALHFVPSMLQVFLEAPGIEALDSLRLVVASGEALPPELVRRFAARLGHAALHNLYGPTEASVDVSFWPAEAGPDRVTVPIGRPISNLRLHVVDRHLHPQPIGVHGELLLGGVGGMGLARGYLGRPELTAAAFIPDPFGEEPGGRLYRTGDLARRLPDGNVDFLGRIDHQVKVRGVRIELGEIEAVLGSHPEVGESVVLVREDSPGVRLLAAYVVGRGGASPGALETGDLRGFLQQRLPETMIPTAFVILESLPLTSSGKVDRKALGRVVPDRAAGEEGSRIAPRGGDEELIAALWSKTLGIEPVERIGARDNFFTLGGHSLLATRLVFALRDAFGVDLPVRSVFQASTVAEQAELIASARGVGVAAVGPIPRLSRTSEPLRAPLSFAQERLWFLDRLASGNPFYNMPGAVRLAGPLDRGVLERSFAELIRRHEALRTTFVEVAGAPVQVIGEGAVAFPIVDLAGLPEAVRDTEVGRVAQAEAERPFDLARGPLVRTTLLALDPEDHVALVTLHHVVSDGWSMGVLVQEIGALYAAFREGGSSPLAPLPVQYADYAAWQRSWLQGDELRGQLDHWRQVLAGAPPVLDLPADRPRPAVESFRGGRVDGALSAELLAPVEALAAAEGTTPFVALLSAFALLLGRLSGQDDLLIGTPVANRGRAELEKLIGLFVNELVLRADLAGDPAFRELLRRQRAMVLDAFAHAEVPFERLVEELRPGRDLARNPLFQVSLVLNEPSPAFSLPGLRLSGVAPTSGTAKMDLTLHLHRQEKGMLVGLEYSTDLFDRETIVRLLDNLRAVLAEIGGAPDRPLSGLPLLAESERRQILEASTGPALDLPQTTVDGWIAEQARRRPEAEAVVGSGERMTWRQLDRRAREIAAALRQAGVGPEVPVAILAERTPETVAAILGILRAGGAYVPLDPNHPEERRNAVLADSGARLLPPGLAGDPERAPEPGAAAGPDHLAYVIYTSGSTGRPKGVRVTHRNLLASTRARLGFYPEPSRRFLMVSSFAFDSSVAGLFWTLCQGGCLVLPEDGRQSDPERLCAIVAAERATHWLGVPSLWSALLGAARGGELASLSTVMMGGEAVPPSLIERHERQLPGVPLINEYGPTEGTVWATACRLDSRPLPAAGVPIGHPIPGGRSWIVDRRGAPAPLGAEGELLLGGPGVARDYLDRPDLTAERFVPDPFGGESGMRLYRTGDRVRRMADGEIVFLGRVDHQIKIRGFRIEPGEIEVVLASHPQVRKAAVLAVESAPGDHRLVAYVVPWPGESPEPRELRGFLSARLPEPMVPAVFVMLDALPLNPNGKLDRKALPAPEHAPGPGFVAPRTPVEEVLAEIWSEVLGPDRVERVGSGDDFFALGGHSLLVTQVVSRVREAFGVELPLRALFESPSLAELAARIELERSPVPAPPILPRSQENDSRAIDPPLSFAQQRLWFLDQLAPGNPFYNVSGMVRLTGLLDVAALRQAFQEIIRRHESLRTTFRAGGGDPVQVIAPEADLPVPLIDLAASGGELERLTGEEAWRPFDLARGPLVRAQLIRLGAREHSLLVSLHHIISDGWSMGILFRELAALYEAFSQGRPSPLAELPIQYADFAVWQREWLREERLEAQLDYWRRQLAELPGTLDLPFDHPRPAVESFRGGSQSFDLPAALVRELTALTRRRGATLSMTVLAGFRSLLARYAGQEDVPVGVAIANRTRREMEGLIGFFVNTLVLRTHLSGSPGFGELIARERDTALEAYTWQDLPFERLVEELQPERNLSRNPLIQVMFGYQNFPRTEIEVRGLTLSSPEAEAMDAGTAKFDLTLFLFEEAGRFRGTLEYNSDLFEPATVRRLLGHFENLLSAAVADPGRPMELLPLLSAAEMHQLATEWNAGVAAPDVSLQELFEAQVRRDPEAPALVFGAGVLSYRELNRRANRLAHRLHELGVGAESRVGLCLERSPELIAGLLGILKAGGAYVPLDPDYPRERLSFMVADSGLRVLVGEAAAVRQLPESLLAELEVVLLEDSPGFDEDPPVAAGGDSLAYVMYTSGSTGRPKGVAVPHRAVARLVRDTDFIRLGPEQVFLQFAPVSFDASTLEIWGPLLNGGRLVIPPAHALSLEELGREIECHGVTTLWLTAGLFHQFVENHLDLLRPVRQLLAGGDVLSVAHVRRVLAELPETRLINGYGPTENTTFTCCHSMPAMQGEERLETSVPIGRPVAHTWVHLLDSHGQPVPLGVAGELCAGGSGLARGYLGRPDLTAERFVPDPLTGGGNRVYRTGDLARRLPDGTIEFLGRIDQQVKMRGFRIEPGEIEAHLGEHPAVLHNVVMAREDIPRDKRLVAYVVQDPAYGVPRGAESEVQSEQVSQWSEIFDDIYRREAAESDPTFNVIGWDSSYTGRPLPEAEMEEWLRDTIDRIAALEPRRVLEIGCGTGMILFRIAPGCEVYTGTDISARVLGYVESHLDAAGVERSRVQLLRRPAERFDGMAAGSYDTVILNSVVQYFPSADYLAEVIARAVEVVRPGGAIFLGDLRSLPLLDAFDTSVELFRADLETPVPHLRQRLHARRLHENELSVAPAFFQALRRRLPGIGRVEIHPKRGEAHNELTAFRYQVVLRVGAAEEKEIPFRDWQAEGMTLASLRRLLEQDAPEGLPEVWGLREIPNARTAEAAAAVRLLREAEEGVETAGDLRRRAAEAAEGAVDPQDLWDLGRELPYDIELSQANPGREGRFEAVLRRRLEGTGPISALLPAPRVASAGPLSQYTNNPLQGRFARQIAPELRAFLADRLPDHMVPAAFVLLDALPLSPNGKVDRRRLPAPDLAGLETGRPLAAPRSQTEERLLEIWRQLLGIERIGVDDDFFVLGGHSLLATQAVSRVRRELGVELPLRTFFEAPTVAALALEVETLSRVVGEAVPPITPVKREGPLPLSFAQERLWFLHLLDRRVLAYNESAAFRLLGRLDEAAFRWSLDDVVRRHESLRTVFPEVESWGAQQVLPPVSFGLPSVDLRGLPEPLREEEAGRLAIEQARHPFDLARGPLVRGLLVRLEEREHAVLFFFHHIVFDGWSTAIFVRELSTLYAAQVAGEPSPLPELPVQYADFAVWQRRWLQGEVLEGQLSYWRERLTGVPVLDLPTDHPRRARSAAAGDWRPVLLAPELTHGLRAISRRQGTTLFMTLLAAFQALLYRITGQDDVAVGSPIANRNRGELEDLIGFFVNMLVLRTDLSGNPAFAELVDRVRETALGAYAHQDLPFEKLVGELQPDRDLLHNPLFQVGFQLLNLPPGGLEMPGLSVHPFPFAARFAKFDLNLALTEEAERISGVIDYDTGLFEAPTVDRLVRHFATLLAAVAADPSAPLSDLPLLTSEERLQLLEWSGVGADPATGTLHGLFAERVRQAPDAPAVTFEGETLSYGELSRRSNQLARRLRDLGAGPESRVALCLERSPDLVVGILGILKAGGAYVPLDPGSPRERLAYMIEDSGARLVVGTAESVAAVPDVPRAILLDAHRKELEALPSGDLEPLGDGASLAYVIYTSGSTGQPKGALVTHGNAVRLFEATRDWFGFGERDVWTLFHSYAFDFSVWEIWGALLHGGRLVVVPYEMSRSPERFLDLLTAEKVTVLNQTPSAFAELARVDQERGGVTTHLRLVIFGGEALDLPSLAPWFARHGEERPRLVNMYGITETTVHVTYRPLRTADAHGERRGAIGAPIPDLGLYVLDPWLRPAPIGVPGELVVGGAGLARGYLGRPELTAERFVPDPVSGRAGARLYRSGDLGRFLPDGDVEYLGRIDHQVKIRGFRIELGEIQAALEEHPAVRQAIVLPKEEPGGERRLLAFLTVQPGAEPSVGDLRAALARRLPDYMIPAGFVFVDDLPLTRNGKVDRKALLAMAVLGRDEEVAYAPPRNAAQATLVEVWREVLGLDRIGIDDRFFSLGGDSILSIRVCALARQRGLSLSLNQLFEHQTVRELAENLGEGADALGATEPFALLTERDRQALPEGLEDAYPLAALQTGMLFHSGYTAESTLYHNVTSLRLETPFDGEALRDAIGQLLARHPVLRTSFDASRFSEPLQLVHRQVQTPLEVEDLRALPPEERDRRVAGAVEEERRRKLDETVPPLLRFRVHLLEDGVFQITWTEHHAILDGWSVATLTAELFRLYRELRQGRPTPPPPFSPATFRDFVALERRSLASDEDRAFWLRKLEAAPRLRLPRRPGSQESEAPRMRLFGLHLDAGLAERLQRLAGGLGVPLKNVLLAAHYRVLSATTGQPDLVSGLVVNGRPEVEGGDRVLGLFLNTIPLRLRLAEGSWTELVRQTFEAEQELSPFRRYPMADLQHRLGGGALFETAFNYVHFHVLQGLAGNDELRVLGGTEHAETNLPFNVSFTLDGTRLSLIVEYDETLFDTALAEAIAARYPRALELMTAHPEESWDARLLLSEPERHQLLHEWNDTQAPVPDRPVHELFHLRAAAMPEAVALVQGNLSLTYGELSNRAGRLAGLLRSLGVGPEVRVGLLLDRSPDLIVGILGILQAGGAYVPLDPEHPETRLRHIVEDSRMPVLVTRPELARSLPSGVSTVLIDDDENGQTVEAPTADLAYVIYTSGSTGVPKGVLVGHGPLANAIGFSVRRYGLTPADRVLQFASISFDASLEEIFAALVSGATLVLRDDAMLESPRHLLDAAGSLGVTVLSLPTAYWHKAVAALAAGEARWPSSIRLVSIGGERAQAEPLAKWLALGLAGVELVNVYGPTEATIGCTHAALRDAEPEVPIGRPYANARVYLLGADLQPVPAGSTGELAVGGVVLARGYLGMPALTAERFVPDPFHEVPGARMYRTGDLAAHRPDGILEFRGRVDAQVKVRGFRIELGEIEAALSRHSGVREAVVVAREHEGETVLAGYVVPGEPRPTAGDLHRFLREQLPAYMVPPALVLLDRLPLTVHGKVDLEALPIPERMAGAESEALPPRDALELRLVRLWEELLSVQPIGVGDDFFELGGHSLTAVQLVARLQRSLGVSLSMATLVRHPTIESLAAVLRGGGETSHDTLVELAPGTGRPFYCVHALGGEVFGYVHLARRFAANGRPFYGLQAAETGEPGTLEEMAVRYLHRLREAQPAGPYTLGGWSMGGVVAFEMARQLQRQGETVDRLVLLDSYAPGSENGPLRGDGELVALFAYELAHLMGSHIELPPDFRERATGDALSWLTAEAERLGLLPPGVDTEEIARRFAVFRANFRALERYAGGSCDAPALLLRAAGSPAEAGWASLLTRPAEVLDLPGDHYSLLRPPLVEELAAALRERLGKG